MTANNIFYVVLSIVSVLVTGVLVPVLKQKYGKEKVLSAMEAILNQDGSIEYRIEDNLSDDEEEIAATLPLKPSYWADTLTDWGLYDEANNTINTDADQEKINEFIEEVLKDAFVER